jgi:HK97 family phage prohead protease
MTQLSPCRAERRGVSRLPLEVRRDKGTPVIYGIAAPYGKLSSPIGAMGFREQIRPGAFTESLASSIDVFALVDHEDDKVLGRRSTGSLEISDTKEGLSVEIFPPETSFAQDLIVLIQAGEVGGMSIGFTTEADRWDMLGGETIRTLLQVNLFDISVCFQPAYPDTRVAVRWGNKRRQERLNAMYRRWLDTVRLAS